MPERKRESIARNHTDRSARAIPDEPPMTFLRGWDEDLVRLASMSDRARRGDTAALGEVSQIARRIHGKSALLGANRVGASAEAIEQLASKILDDLEAHGPIAESALVGQLSEFIDALSTTAAVGRKQRAHARSRRARAAAGPPATLPPH
jgi:HPt (histidine-containing phosphotransfer) domain-containing protein